MKTQSLHQVHCGEKSKCLYVFCTAKEVGFVDSHVVLLLLHQCSSFCRMVHTARCTPLSAALEGLHLFDEEVCQTFSDSMCIDPSDLVWPSLGLNLHLDKVEIQTALKWWLGIDMFGGSRCPSCSTQSLDPLGHHP